MKKVIVLTLIIMCVSISAKAGEVEEMQSRALELDKLIDSAPEDVNIDISSNTSLDEGLQGIVSRIKNEIGSVFTHSLSCIGVIITVTILSAIVGSVQGNTLNKPLKYMDAVSAVAITAAASGSVNTFIGMAEDAISSMRDFSIVLFPALSATVATSGSPVGAVVRHSASVMFSGTFISVISAVLIPLLYTYIASSTANAAIDGSPLSKICSLLEWVISGAIKIILTVFLAYISVSGFVATTADMAGVKTISAISSAVPVVGAILSNATGAVLGGAKVLKNAVGIFGLISIMSICLTPCLVLGVNYVVFKVTGAVISPVCEAKISELIGKIGSAFGMMLAITASCALLLFISIISCMFAIGIS